MRRTLALCCGLVTLALGPMAYADNVSALQNGLTTFVNNATASLPFAASAGLDWSDAYIGSIVGVPPHFGIGLVTGATTLPGKNISPLVNALGGSLGMTDVPVPLVALNGRIGGFLLPFDIGLKVGTVPGGVTINNYNVTYQNYGFDVRYAVFQGEPLLPNVSVGGGVDYFASQISTTYGSSLTYTNGSNTLYVGAPKAVLDLSSVTFEGKVQVSKSFLILTPYLGLSALVGSSTAKATVTSNITSSTGNVSDWSQYVSGISGTGFGLSNTQTGFGLKVFGGTSINIVLFRIDLQGMYSLLDGAYGGTLGFRFQL